MRLAAVFVCGFIAMGAASVQAVHVNAGLPSLRNALEQTRRQPRPRPRPQRRRPQPNTAAQPPASRPNCQAYDDWLAILDKELADISPANTLVDRLYPRVLNVFRDEHFVPLFGKPFADTTADERRSFYMAVRNGCGQISPEARERFRRWDVIVQRPFFPGRGSFSAQEVVAGLAERKEILARMRQPVRQAGTTVEDFTAANRDTATATRDLQKLWPREERVFLGALTERREEMVQASPESRRLSTIADARAGVEGSPGGGQLITNDLVYIDAAIASGQPGNLETLPVEEVFQWLYDEKFKCLQTGRVVWVGREGQASAVQFGTKRFVIDCRGDCRGIRYRVGGNPGRRQVWHYGLSRPVPVIQAKSTVLSQHPFTWVFSRDTAAGTPPDIRVHSWSSVMGDYGPGCAID
ncbi:MAG: hypothetical protein AB7O32_07735 [Vicinamibacterales bacterium]